MSCNVETLSWCAIQGRDFGVGFALTDDDDNPIDLTEGTLYCQVRKSVNQKSQLLADFMTDGTLTLDAVESNRANININAERLDSMTGFNGVGDVRFIKDGRSHLLFRFSLRVKSNASGVAP